MCGLLCFIVCVCCVCVCVQVYTVDARNHGETEHRSDMTYDLMSQDTLKFIQDQGLEKVILVGG